MRAPSVDTVVTKFLRRKTAGANTFYEYAKGTNLKAVYDGLVADALREYGQDPYSGTIATTRGVELRSKVPMSMDDAEAFAKDDVEKANKWETAFAVPVAQSRVKSKVTVTADVAAASKSEAESSFREKTLKEKPVRVSNMGIAVQSVVLKDAEMPKLKVEPGKTKTYSVVVYPTHQTFADGLTSKKDAVAKLKDLFKDTYFRDFLSKPGAYIVICENKDLTILRPETISLPTWVVTADVAEVELGPVEGYLIYGWAAT